MENAEMKLSDNKISLNLSIGYSKENFEDKELHFNYYTLTHLLSHNIYLLNMNVIKFCNLVLEKKKYRKEKFIKISRYY